MTDRSASRLWLVGLLAGLLGLWACAAARGQSIEGPGRIEPGTLARLSIEAEGDLAAAWIVFPPGAGDVDPCDPDGRRAVFTAPPRPEPYTILVAVVRDGRPAWLTHRVAVAPAAPPPPAPGPDDPPPPAPEKLGRVARVLILLESAEVTGREPFYAASVRDQLHAMTPAERLPDGRTWKAWRIWDRDLDPASEPTWADALAKARAHEAFRGLPAVFVFDEQGRLDAFKLPATDGELVEKLKSYEGAGS